MSKVADLGGVSSSEGFEALLGISDASLRPIRNSLDDPFEEALNKPQGYYDCLGWGLTVYLDWDGLSPGLDLHVKSDGPSLGEAGSPNSVRRYRLAATAHGVDKSGCRASFKLFVLDETLGLPCYFRPASHVPKHSCLIYGAAELAGFATIRVVDEKAAEALMERFPDRPIRVSA